MEDLFLEKRKIERTLNFLVANKDTLSGKFVKKEIKRRYINLRVGGVIYLKNHGPCIVTGIHVDRIGIIRKVALAEIVGLVNVAELVEYTPFLWFLENILHSLENAIYFIKLLFKKEKPKTVEEIYRQNFVQEIEAEAIEGEEEPF